MTLLKNDGSIPEKIHRVEVAAIGLNISDGWNFGIGFGLAMIIAVPTILFLIVSLIGLILVLLGAL